MMLDFYAHEATAKVLADVAWRDYTALPGEYKDVITVGHRRRIGPVTEDTPSATVRFESFVMLPNGTHVPIDARLIDVDIQTDRGFYKLFDPRHLWTVPRLESDAAVWAGQPSEWSRLTLFVRVGDLRVEGAIRLRAVVGGSLVMWSQPFITLSKDLQTKAHWAHVVPRKLIVPECDVRWQGWTIWESQKGNVGPFRGVLDAVTPTNFIIAVPPKWGARCSARVIHVGEYRRAIVYAPPSGALDLSGLVRRDASAGAAHKLPSIARLPSVVVAMELLGSPRPVPDTHDTRDTAADRLAAICSYDTASAFRAPGKRARIHEEASVDEADDAKVQALLLQRRLEHMTRECESLKNQNEKLKSRLKTTEHQLRGVGFAVQIGSQK
jgi:hypothetical protein